MELSRMEEESSLSSSSSKTCSARPLAENGETRPEQTGCFNLQGDVRSFLSPMIFGMPESW